MRSGGCSADNWADNRADIETHLPLPTEWLKLEESVDTSHGKAKIMVEGDFSQAYLLACYWRVIFCVKIVYNALYLRLPAEQNSIKILHILVVTFQNENDVLQERALRGRALRGRIFQHENDVLQNDVLKERHAVLVASLERMLPYADVCSLAGATCCADG